MGFIRKADMRKKSSPKRLYVHPSELAEKLIKEMEDHKTWGADRVWVRDRYTVYLCLDDYERLRGKKDKIRDDLTRRLYEHVEDMGYEVAADIEVDIVLDRELELGRFGILAHSALQDRSAAQPAAAQAPSARAAAPAAPAGAAGAATFTPPTGSQQAAAVTPSPATGEASAAAAAAAAVGAAAAAGVSAGEAGPARPTIVLSSGDQVGEFTGGRAVIGRGRDVDFRIDDPGVSRQHAAVFWANDKLMVEDLGSTNGTMVNGYPVTKTVLGPRDVIVIGERRITVETK